MPTSLTVTATQGGGTFQGMLLRVKVLTGTAATQNGATATSAAAVSVSITTTVTGSLVYGAISGEPPAFTATAACTLIDNYHDATNAEQYGSFRTTSATGTPGSVSVGSTTGGITFADIAAAEILASGTIAEDSSGPAVVTSDTLTSLTTASFTPPDGSLLVALVGSDGAANGTSVTTMTVSGGGLTWTELAHAATVSTTYAGVWIARVPASSASLPPGAARRQPYRLAALPPVRRYRQTLPVPKQLNPPYLFAEITQRRETWTRGMPRRGRQVSPVPPQLNPPYPVAETRQWRQARGFWPRRGHGFTPVPAQQAAAPAPAFVPQSLRHARLALAALRRRPPGIPAAQDIPPQQARRARPALPPRRSRLAAFLHGQHAPPPQRPPGRQRWLLSRRGRVTWPPQAQAPVPPPAWVPPHRAPTRALTLPRRGRIAWPPQAQAAVPPPAWVQSHRSPSRALALIRRRFRQLLPWPQAVQPAFSIGALTAADVPSGTLAAAGASSALTAATAAQGTLTATDQRTGGPG